MKDEEPIFVKSFKPIYAHKKIIEEQVQQWLKNDIIRPSDSKFDSPIFLVPKRTGPDGAKRYRLVVPIFEQPMYWPIISVTGDSLHLRESRGRHRI